MVTIVTHHFLPKCFPWQPKSCDMSTISLWTGMRNMVKIKLTKLKWVVALFHNISSNFIWFYLNTPVWDIILLIRCRVWMTNTSYYTWNKNQPIIGWHLYKQNYGITAHSVTVCASSLKMHANNSVSLHWIVVKSGKPGEFRKTRVRCDI